MSQIGIQKCRNPKQTSQTLLQKMDAVMESIRQRALSLLERLDDWIKGEGEVIWSPSSELMDREKEFTARIAVRSFDAKDVQLSVVPDAPIVQADKPVVAVRIRFTPVNRRVART